MRCPSRRSVAAVARHALFVTTTLAASVGLFSACSQDSSSSAGNGGGVFVPSGPPGEAIYLRSCARCHGNDRIGDGTAPALDATRVASLGDEPMRFTIAYGKGQMPGFGGLTPTEVDDLINYLRNF